jgi:hypothetical protein
METWMGDGEEGGDVLAIPGEFLETMRERVGCCSDSLVPSDRPLSSVLNGFRGLNRSERELEFSEPLNLEIVIGG